MAPETFLTKSLFYTEIAALVIGWFSGLFFMLYSEGVFDGSHQWSAQDLEFILIAIILLVPYAVLGLFYWLFQRYAIWFLIGTVGIVIFSGFNYYSVYFPTPQPDGGWIFLMLPVIQMFLDFVLLVPAIALKMFENRKIKNHSSKK